jgi:hypothetical protein
MELRVVSLRDDDFIYDTVTYKMELQDRVNDFSLIDVKLYDI